MPEMAGARDQATRSTHDIAVKEAGLIVAKEGPIDLKRLGEYLQEEAKKTKQPTLLVNAEASVEVSQLARIVALAQAADDAGTGWVRRPYQARRKTDCW